MCCAKAGEMKMFSRTYRTLKFNVGDIPSIQMY